MGKLIDGDELIVSLKMAAVAVRADSMIDLLIKTVERVISIAPAVDPVKHAKWIERKTSNGDSYYECSGCKDAQCFIAGTPKDNDVNYCPKCGAKMDLKEDKP